MCSGVVVMWAALVIGGMAATAAVATAVRVVHRRAAMRGTVAHACRSVLRRMQTAVRRCTGVTCSEAT